MSTMTWTIVDHLCRSCGGRVLKSATGAGMTPGGNPIWRCADCGVSKSSTGPNAVCWCGHRRRGQHEMAFVCQPFSKIEQHPDLLDSFRASGINIKRGGEVGVILRRDYWRLMTCTQ